VLYGLSLFAELLANDRPLLVSYRGEYYAPFLTFYSEKTFGGDFGPRRTIPARGAMPDRHRRARGMLGRPRGHPRRGAGHGHRRWASRSIQGWMLWPPIPYSYNTIVNTGGTAPGPIRRRTGWAPTMPAATCWRG
jgi:microcin C transport system permease protein